MIKKVLVRDFYGPLKILEDDGSIWERSHDAKGWTKVSEVSE